MSVTGRLVEDKMRTFKGECAQFSFKKCHVYTHDAGACAEFSTNSHETNNSAFGSLYIFIRTEGGALPSFPQFYS